MSGTADFPIRTIIVLVATGPNDPFTEETCLPHLRAVPRLSGLAYLPACNKAGRER